MLNERLRATIAAKGMSLQDLARAVGVDPKTIERWITTGRVPHRTHRWNTAKALGTDEAYLWPHSVDDQRSKAASESEFIRLYPRRATVPGDTWVSLVDGTKESLDILAIAGLFLPDNYPDFATTLIDKASNGTHVRILIGDPNGESVALRSEEENAAGDGMAGRARLALGYITPAISTAGVEIRLHDTTLYNSIFRSDDTMLVNTHVYGAPATSNPVLHLQRVPGGTLFDHYLASFDRIWTNAEPYQPPPRKNKRKALANQ